jgi:hypothetical protein
LLVAAAGTTVTAEQARLLLFSDTFVASRL